MLSFLYCILFRFSVESGTRKGVKWRSVDRHCDFVADFELGQERLPMPQGISEHFLGA
jgi:hypothetical protein